MYIPEFQIDFGIPVTIPCVAVRTIGAGGGSIAWIDKGGLLHVGPPRSTGPSPGPVAYGRGGEAPTVTDANLVLGRLDPAFFLGGAMPLDLAAAHAALAPAGRGPVPSRRRMQHSPSSARWMRTWPMPSA